MGTYPRAAVERAMKIQEVVPGTVSKGCRGASRHPFLDDQEAEKTGAQEDHDGRFRHRHQVVLIRQPAR